LEDAGADARRVGDESPQDAGGAATDRAIAFSDVGIRAAFRKVRDHLADQREERKKPGRDHA